MHTNYELAPEDVTRFELIDHRTNAGHVYGRVYSVRPCRVELSWQDDGRTLKVFILDAGKTEKTETEVA